ncbi:formimidoylglutamate deiminase [Massilia sp. DWR3-1-1]|uniref:formimidoylglutamate deiminase n=1 Tax=Massilia sp. DWR3-1-1 TaxID=2804559 RepID=UPI003CF86ECB
MNGGAVLARHALLPDGWARDVAIAWNGDGVITAVGATAADAGAAAAAAVGLVIPGMVNLHSHAFQRAMAGQAETAGEGEDSFWTWRELMYRFAGRITPAQLEAVAAQLFVDCLRHGYTSVCEFHYLHRAADGAAYARPAEMAERVAQAARETGIGLTMLPVLYSHGGFGAQPLGPRQRRFQSDVGAVLGMVEALDRLRDGQFEVGAAPHSLRAASMAQIGELAAALPPGRPIHIHIAEQQLEVDACLAHSGQRPLAWLLERQGLDARWCLVHATHLDEAELAALAASGAVAGLCPSTEANLGDGLFALAPYLAAGGRFGIGSDSHVGHSPVEELRWLEYGQRLRQQRRNIAVSPVQRHVGDLLWQAALAGGAQASGRPVGALAVGRRADFLVLDDEHPNLAGAPADEVLGRLLFAGNDNLVRDVLVGGRRVIQDGRHAGQAAIAARYRAALAQLRERSP